MAIITCLENIKYGIISKFLKNAIQFFFMPIVNKKILNKIKFIIQQNSFKIPEETKTATIDLRVISSQIPS